MSGAGRLGQLTRTAIAAWHARLGRRSRQGHYQTSAQDRIPFLRKLAYGAGAFVNNTLAAAIGGMTIILNLGLGMNPALVGVIGAIPRLFDALIDPLMGYISDNTRSRWGRRRPYILAGAIASGLVYVALWRLPRGHTEAWYAAYFLAGSLLFYVAYTVFATPWVALGYELTPDYHERTRLMGVQNFIGQLAYIISPWFLWIMTNKAWFTDSVEGAAGLALAIGVVTIGVGMLPAVFLRERAGAVQVAANPVTAGGRSLKESLGEFFGAFGTSLRSGPFRKLCLATFLVFNSFIMISSFQYYVIIYYVFAGDQERGAQYAGYSGTLGAVSTFGVILLVTWLATRLGKRRAFTISTTMSIVGYLAKWFCYNPRHPWLLLLPAPLLAFGLGGLFTLMGSMICDVVDEDELATAKRREGMYGAIYWWVVKLGMAAALAAGGYLLNATGFDVALAGAQAPRTILLMRLCDMLIPALASGVAIWAITSYPITEERAHEVRAALEQRRGRLDAATA